MKLSSYREASFRFWSCVYEKFQASEFEFLKFYSLAEQHAGEACMLKLFYLKFFSALAGRRGGGVCISADSAAVGEADALINIGAEYAPSRCNNSLV